MGEMDLLLPKYARFLLDNCLPELCKKQLQLSQQHNLPLLKYLANYSQQELLELTRVAMIEFLNSLVYNAADEFMRSSMEKWINDQLEVVGKNEIETGDIAIISYVRSKSIKSFIPQFTSDLQTIMQVSDEIDTFFFNYNSRSFDTYISIIKERLAKETAFNAKLTDALPGMVYIYDLEEKREVYGNNKRYQLLGHPNDLFTGSPVDHFQSIIHPLDLPAIQNFENLFLNGETDKVKSFEYRLKNANNQYRWLRNYAMVFNKIDNRPKQIIGIAFDVTEEKKLTEMLEERELQLLDAQGIAHLGSYEWNMLEKTSRNTPEFYKIFEIEPGTTFVDFMKNIHPDDQEKVRSLIESSLKTGHFDCEYRYRCASGEKVIWSLGRIIFKDGQAEKMIGTVQDITERKRIENNLVQNSILLHRSNQDLQHFASVASHDLKEPLRKIAMLTDSLLNQPAAIATDNFQENLAKIKSSAVRMQQMVDDILDYSSISISEEKQVCSLQNLLNDVVEMYEHLIKETGTTILVNDLPEASVIPSQFRRLFQNLLANSIKFSVKNVPPVISISHTFNTSSAPAKWLQITFSDNGIGFEQKQASVIFDLFSRLNNSSVYSGSGIGLAICKRITENHAGNITAEGKPGKGATFKISIPA